jgi:hypothetical protein
MKKTLVYVLTVLVMLVAPFGVESVSAKKKYKSPEITKKAYIQELKKQFKDFPLEELDRFQKMCIESLSKIESKISSGEFNPEERFYGKITYNNIIVELETAQKELRRRRGGKKMVIIYDKNEEYISKSKYIY